MWSDFHYTPFTATGPNQFLIRAGGGVGINTNNPGPNALAVLGNLAATSFTGDGSGLTNILQSAIAAPPPGMVLIPAGAFTMGDSLDGVPNATPTVSVTVSAFYMDVNLVSLSQWQSVYYWATSTGYNFNYSGSGKAANNPVQTVDWYDCVKWCNARSQQAGKTPVYYTDAGFTAMYQTGEPGTMHANWAAAGYRLPTEAEWEKAGRGGLIGQRFPWGNTINENLANYLAGAPVIYDLGPSGYNPVGSVGGTSPATSPAGSFAANGYGLYDMAGNVFEWCWDWYPYPNFTPYVGGSDPRGPASGSFRVARGGSGNNTADYAGCADRFTFLPADPDNVIGFRAVLAPGH